MVPMTRYRNTFWVTTKSPLKQTVSICFRKLAKLPNHIMHLHKSRFWFNPMGIFKVYTQTEDWLFSHTWNSKPKQIQPRVWKILYQVKGKVWIPWPQSTTELLGFLLPLSLSHHDLSKISLELFSNFTEQCLLWISTQAFSFTTVLSLSCPAWLTHIKISECLATPNFKLDKKDRLQACANVNFFFLLPLAETKLNTSHICQVKWLTKCQFSCSMSAHKWEVFLTALAFSL